MASLITSWLPVVVEYQLATMTIIAMHYCEYFLHCAPHTPAKSLAGFNPGIARCNAHLASTFLEYDVVQATRLLFQKKAQKAKRRKGGNFFLRWWSWLVSDIATLCIQMDSIRLHSIPIDYGHGQIYRSDPRTWVKIFNIWRTQDHLFPKFEHSQGIGLRCEGGWD